MRFQAPRGTEDVLPADSHKWVRLESAFRSLAGRYGYREIRTPTFEDRDLFLRTAGESSDVVTKQMYEFQDKGGRDICLKAEGTAPAMRAMIEHGLLQPGTVQKVFYVTPVFRYERPQKGRLREHHQVGIELIGSPSPAADAEVIEIAVEFYRGLGLRDFRVLVNSIGREDCRDRYRAALLEFAEPMLASMSEEGLAQARKNPLRLLDSKDPAMIEWMKSAPLILDYLEPESAERFKRLQTYLKDAGIDFEVAPRIVRGLDYYTETVFELDSSQIGAQGAIGGGGRYDGLIEQIGGPPTPSVGFGIGIERALLALEAAGVEFQPEASRVFVASAGEAHFDRALALSRELRAQGCSVLNDPDGRSLKSQFRQADKAGATYIVILGDEEADQEKVSLKDLRTGDQEMLSWEAARARILS